MLLGTVHQSSISITTSAPGLSPHTHIPGTVRADGLYACLELEVDPEVEAEVAGKKIKRGRWQYFASVSLHMLHLPLFF